MDAKKLREIFERLDGALTTPTVLRVRGGAAILSCGFEGRVTVDIDVLPSSSYVEQDLRRACEAAGLLFNPEDKDFPPGDYLVTVPEETLILPVPSKERPYNSVFRGHRLTVWTPPAADLIVGKLKRLEPEDLADVHFLVARFGIGEAVIREAFSRLPESVRADPVLQDNLRYLIEDLP